MRMTTKIAIAMVMAANLIDNAQQTAVRQAVLLPGVEMQTGASLVPVQQVKDDLFVGTEKFAARASEGNEINLDPKTMGMVPSGKDGGDLARKMRFMVIRNYTYDKPGMYSMEDVEVYRRKLNDGSWNCSIRVRDKDGSTDICSREIPGGGSEMVIIAAEPKELSFIHISGNMSLKDLQKMNGMGRLTH